MQYNTFPLIEAFYITNRPMFIKRMTFRSGTVWDAEDIVQEAFARALKYAKSLEPERLGNWFNTILNNTFHDHMNEARGYSQEDDELEEESVSCVGYPSRVMKEIYELIGTKSEVQMEVLNLHIFEDYSASDIAKISPYSYAQVHQIITRFRNELKTLYKE